MKITESQLRQIIREEIQEGFGQEIGIGNDPVDIRKQKLIKKLEEVVDAALNRKQYGISSIYLDVNGNEIDLTENDFETELQGIDERKLEDTAKLNIIFAEGSELAKYAEKERFIYDSIYGQSQDNYYIEVRIKDTAALDDVIEFFE